jgi:hypothetical protein
MTDWFNAPVALTSWKTIWLRKLLRFQLGGEGKVIALTGNQNLVVHSITPHFTD